MQRQTTSALMGMLGKPRNWSELVQTVWDVVIIGAGHNGLTCAAYLARAGRKVLVLEARDRVGGACTLHETWPGFSVSPCAYLAGLLHRQVVQDLDLARYGFEWIPALEGMFVPFADGSFVQLWDDAERCEAEVARFAPGDLSGWRELTKLIGRVRAALRPPDHRDIWLQTKAPSRDEIADRVGNDRESLQLLFEWSMVDMVERYLDNEKLQMALLGQGIIGTNASPFDPGTASIHFHHSSGQMDGHPGTWGYVKGGMGKVSFYLCDAAQAAGAVIVTGVPVAKILPGDGVELVSGEHVRCQTLVSNADPVTTAALLGRASEPTWLESVNHTPIQGCTLKVTLSLSELPNFRARPGIDEVHHRGQINTPLSKAEWKSCYEQSRAGELPETLWTELYFQSAVDSSVAPAGRHSMSVFAQYVPYRLATGSWSERRHEAAKIVLDTLGKYCSNIPDSIVELEALGPPDIEERVGLHGGHIFQGECLPEYMWDKRLPYATPMEGVYLCGACTYPGGSVIAVNGRNAALTILEQA